jgi:uncharacterized protein YlxW (UPF0749 family)
LDQREEKMKTIVCDLNQRHNTIPISERLRAMKEMKNLQVEVSTIQEERQTRQAQLDPLQDQAEEMIIEMETKKYRMEHAHS